MQITKFQTAIIEPVGGHGGMNYYDLGLARGLANNDCGVFLYTSTETNVENGLSFRVIKNFKGIWGKTPKILRAFRFFICLFITLQDIKCKSINLVHYHFFHYTAVELFCVKLAKVFRCKIVITAHDVESFFGHHSIKNAQIIFASADAIIAHNRISKNELVDKLNLIDEKIYVIPHGNYLDFIENRPSRDKAREILGLSPEEKIILFFGQIKEVKGLDILIQSLPEVLKRYPSLKLLIAGKVWKDNLSTYEKIISNYSLRNNVIFHTHYIPDNEVSNYYCASDLVVLPYRRIYQSGVLLMAMSYKIPVLASDIPGMTEIIVDGQNGYTFKSEDVEDLSQKIIKIFSNSDDLPEIAEKGYKTVVTEHCWDTIGKLTSEVYKKVCYD